MAVSQPTDSHSEEKNKHKDPKQPHQMHKNFRQDFLIYNYPKQYIHSHRHIEKESTKNICNFYM